MTKTVEQFDAQADEVVKALTDGMREPMTKFYAGVTSLGEEMGTAGIPPHLQIAIINKMERGMETSLNALQAEIEGTQS